MIDYDEKIAIAAEEFVQAFRESPEHQDTDFVEGTYRRLRGWIEKKESSLSPTP